MASTKGKIASGKIDQVKGRAKATTGKVTNDKSLQAKGKVQQVKGVVKEGAGKAKRAVSN